MKYNTPAKAIPSKSVRINNDVYHKVMHYAISKGMKLTKVIEFAILDYLTKSQK